MKTLVLIGGVLLLALLVSPAGHGAHHRHPCDVRYRAARAPQLLPLRVVRTPAVARQPRRVQAVR